MTALREMAGAVKLVLPLANGIALPSAGLTASSPQPYFTFVPIPSFFFFFVKPFQPTVE